MEPRNPDLAYLLNYLKARTLADIRVALPGRVERYDASIQVADVQPLIRDTLEQEDGSGKMVDLPIITNVPVIFPGGGGMRITFPVAPGDTVLLVFNDRSIDGWQTTGAAGTPVDGRRHHLADAVAIPGLHPNSAPWSPDPAAITIGADAAPADFVALSSLVTDALTALKDAIAAAAPSGVGAMAALNTSLATWPPAVASTTVKIKG